MNLADLVVEHPARARAVHDAEGWHSWGDVRARAARTAAAVVRSGVAPGDRVAFAWPASAAFVATYLGILAAGAVAVPLNPSDPVEALVAELGAVTPALVLAGGADAARLAEAGARSSAAVLAGDGPDGDWAAALADVGDAPFAPRHGGRDDVAVLLFTSGTAGDPKPAMLTHANLRANLRQLLAVPGVEAQPADVGLCTLPLFHVFGLNVALGLSLATGSPVAVMDRFTPEEAARLMGDLGVTVAVGAPAAFAHWLHGGFVGAGNGTGPPPVRSLRLAVAGGAPVPPDLAREFEAALGLPLHQGYGLTEASPAVATTIGEDRPRPGSSGRALPGMAVRLVDEGGAEALAGDPGEIWVRGPNVFAGYHGDAEATAAVRDASGWLRTGDVGVAGPNGDLFVVDRCKDLVIVSGFNVYPAEVERVLVAAPGVAEAVVVGRPDALAGEVLEAVVVPADPSAPPDEQAVRAHCAARLPRYKCPVVVRVVPRLPRSISGEALRRRVRRGGGLPVD